MFEPSEDNQLNKQTLRTPTKIIKSTIFALILLVFLFWDGVAVFLQFFLMQWFWIPIILLICSFSILVVSVIFFTCITKYSLFPFGVLRLLMLLVVISLWSLNLLRWFNNDRNPSWRDGLDRVWTDVQALGFNYCILFGWLAISSVMLFVVFIIHYFPKMKLYPCCMDIYESLQNYDDNQLMEDMEIELEEKTPSNAEDEKYFKEEDQIIKIDQDDQKNEQTIEFNDTENAL